MKKITLIIMLLLTTISLSQKVYPIYEKDSIGNNLVIMTLEQAQSLDNKAELLLLFEKLNMSIESYDSICIKVISDKEKVILEQNILIKSLKDLSNNKDDQMVNIKGQITDYKNREELNNKIIKNKDEEIKLHIKEITKLKTKMVIGGGAVGLTIIGLIILLIK